MRTRFGFVAVARRHPLICAMAWATVGFAGAGLSVLRTRARFAVSAFRASIPVATQIRYD